MRNMRYDSNNVDISTVSNENENKLTSKEQTTIFRINQNDASIHSEDLSEDDCSFLGFDVVSDLAKHNISLLVGHLNENVSFL